MIIVNIQSCMTVYDVVRFGVQADPISPYISIITIHVPMNFHIYLKQSFMDAH